MSVSALRALFESKAREVASTPMHTSSVPIARAPSIKSSTSSDSLKHILLKFEVDEARIEQIKLEKNAQEIISEISDTAMFVSEIKEKLVGRMIDAAVYISELNSTAACLADNILNESITELESDAINQSVPQPLPTKEIENTQLEKGDNSGMDSAVDIHMSDGHSVMNITEIVHEILDAAISSIDSSSCNLEADISSIDVQIDDSVVDNESVEYDLEDTIEIVLQAVEQEEPPLDQNDTVIPVDEFVVQPESLPYSIEPEDSESISEQVTISSEECNKQIDPIESIEPTVQIEQHSSSLESEIEENFSASELIERAHHLQSIEESDIKEAEIEEAHTIAESEQVEYSSHQLLDQAYPMEPVEVPAIETAMHSSSLKEEIEFSSVIESVSVTEQAEFSSKPLNNQAYTIERLEKSTVQIEQQSYSLEPEIEKPESIAEADSSEPLNDQANTIQKPEESTTQTGQQTYSLETEIEESDTIAETEQFKILNEQAQTFETVVDSAVVGIEQPSHLPEGDLELQKEHDEVIIEPTSELKNSPDNEHTLPDWRLDSSDIDSIGDFSSFSAELSKSFDFEMEKELSLFEVEPIAEPKVYPNESPEKEYTSPSRNDERVLEGDTSLAESTSNFESPEKECTSPSTNDECVLEGDTLLAESTSNFADQVGPESKLDTELEKTTESLGSDGTPTSELQLPELEPESVGNEADESEVLRLATDQLKSPNSGETPITEQLAEVESESVYDKADESELPRLAAGQIGVPNSEEMPILEEVAELEPELDESNAVEEPVHVTEQFEDEPMVSSMRSVDFEISKVDIVSEGETNEKLVIPSQAMEFNAPKENNSMGEFVQKTSRSYSVVSEMESMASMEFSIISNDSNEIPGRKLSILHSGILDAVVEEDDCSINTFGDPSNQNQSDEEEFDILGDYYLDVESEEDQKAEEPQPEPETIKRPVTSHIETLQSTLDALKRLSRISKEALMAPADSPPAKSAKFDAAQDAHVDSIFNELDNALDQMHKDCADLDELQEEIMNSSGNDSESASSLQRKRTSNKVLQMLGILEEEPKNMENEPEIVSKPLDNVFFQNRLESVPKALRTLGIIPSTPMPTPLVRKSSSDSDDALLGLNRRSTGNTKALKTLGKLKLISGIITTTPLSPIASIPPPSMPIPATPDSPTAKSPQEVVRPGSMSRGSNLKALKTLGLVESSTVNANRRRKSSVNLNEGSPTFAGPNSPPLPTSPTTSSKALKTLGIVENTNVLANLQRRESHEMQRSKSVFSPDIPVRMSLDSRVERTQSMSPNVKALKMLGKFFKFIKGIIEPPARRNHISSRGSRASSHLESGMSIDAEDEEILMKAPSAKALKMLGIVESPLPENHVSSSISDDSVSEKKKARKSIMQSIRKVETPSTRRESVEIPITQENITVRSLVDSVNEGYIAAYNPEAYVRKWKQRYFILTSNSLLFFKSNSLDSVAMGGISIDAETRVNPAKGFRSKFVIEIAHGEESSRNLFLMFLDEEEMQSWTRAIRAIVTQDKYLHASLPRPPSGPPREPPLSHQGISPFSMAKNEQFFGTPILQDMNPIKSSHNFRISIASSTVSPLFEDHVAAMDLISAMDSLEYDLENSA